MTISGSLYSGSIRASGLRLTAAAAEPIKDYTIVAVGTVDDKIYFPDSKTATADGAFSITVPSGESFYLGIVDDSKKFVAPVVMGAAGGKAIMAVTIEASADLGRLVYEAAKGTAVPSLEIAAAKLDSGSTATLKSGEPFAPVGAGDLGRGTGEAFFSGSLKDAVDEDGDGLPDVFDIDDDGDGKVDGLDPAPRFVGRVEVGITGVNNTNTFSNLPEPYEIYPTYVSGFLNTTPINVATVSNLAIEVVMASGTVPATFSDVRVVEGPAWLATATVFGGSTLWSATSYQLTKSSDRWEIHVTPNGTPEAGDVLKFQLTNTATGAISYLLSTITYVFEDIPRLVAYSDNAGTKEAADLNLATYTTNGNKFSYSGSNLTLIFTAPKDDLGSYLTGMLYYLDGINYYDAGGSGLISAGSLALTPTTIEGYPVFGTVYSYTFTPTTEAPFSYFKVDVKAQSPANGGGNASQMVNFKKIP